MIKTSISFPATNPATCRLLEDLGATTINLPVDLSVAQIAAIWQAVDVPLDSYAEGADDFGGVVRYYELPNLVRVAAPIHLKFTVRNAPGDLPVRRTPRRARRLLRPGAGAPGGDRTCSLRDTRRCDR